MGRVLCVGHICVDDVYNVRKYPVEDSTVGSRTSPNRCTNQSWERGGNASNSATVLAELGNEVEYFGTLADDNLKQFFKDDMDSYGVKYTNCPVLKNSKVGTSVVICSEESGTRTIIHCKGTLTELTHGQFKERINLDNYSWIHFEGRNENQITHILQDIQEYNIKFASESDSLLGQPNYKQRKLPISIEVEKRIESISVLLPFADVAFIGKDYAMMKGARDCLHAAQIFCQQLEKGTVVICPWGEHGAAFGIAGSHQLTKVDPHPPVKIVSSLGAGDTFNAAVIHALTRNMEIEESVRFGCKVAGAKIGICGFRNLLQAIEN